jgi:polyvinyl alcohol dehydrogenase (cytochrome)
MKRVLAIVALIAVSSPAWAVSQYLQNYLSIHPGSGATCVQCHTSPQGGLSFNAYGAAVRSNLAQGMSIAQAIAAADGTPPPPPPPPPPTCTPPMVLQGGTCVQPPPPPPPPPTCVAPQVLVNGACAVPPPPVVTPPGPGPQANASPDVVACGGGWPMANLDIHGSRYAVTERAITPATVGTLALQATAVTAGSVLGTPTVQAGTMYIPDKGGNLSKFDTRTGKPLWTVKASDVIGGTAIIRTSPAICHGVAVVGGWSLDLTAPSTATVAALDQRTGQVRWKRLIDADQGARIMQSPIVWNNTVYVGVGCVAAEINQFFQVPGTPAPTCQGSVVALRLSDGQQVWKTKMAAPGYSGSGVWSDTMSIDTAANTIYAGAGNTFTVPPAVMDCVINMGGGDVGTMCDPVNSVNHNDSLVALDMTTGAVKWAKKIRSQDYYGCGPGCTSVGGAPDYDVLGVQIFDAGGKKFVGTGHKNGSYIALDRTSGDTVWVKNVGSGSPLGGIERSCATDGVGLYCPSMNHLQTPWVLADGTTTSGGYWTRFDAATGKVVWQTANPIGAKALSPMTLLPTGVVFGCSLDPTGECYALDAGTGKVLWHVATGASNGGGVAIFNGRVFVGAGYNGLNDLIPLGNDGKAALVYSLPNQPADPPVTGGGGRSSD